MIKRAVAFSCVHVPQHDKAGIDWLYQQVDEFKPDEIICLGDLLEAKSASRWPDEYSWDLQDEYEAADEILSTIRKIGGKKCRYIWMQGNHDDNIRAVGRIDPELRSLLIPETCMREWRHWKTYPYVFDKRKGVHRIGQVYFNHGYAASLNADKTHAIKFGSDQAFSLTVSGHTHRPVHVTQVKAGQKLPLKMWYMNVGTFMQTDPMPNYMKRNDSELWGQGVALIEAEDTKSPRMKKCWDAELKIRKMAWDD